MSAHPFARPSRKHLLLAAATLAMGVSAPVQAQNTVWSDTKRPAEERAAALVSAMTSEEKFELLHTLFPPRVIGTPGAPTDMLPSAGYSRAIPRLGIPELRESDASLGVANQVEQRKGDTATALPASLATASSFDPAIAYAGGAMIGAEARAKTFNVLLAGGVNLTRDPWGGRNFEYLGEDPLLSGVMAGEHIRGVQSNHIMSTVKHFALNSQETGRMIADARLDWPAMHESDLLAFKIAIERGKPASVMCSYNRVNGDYACENHMLLTDILRGQWGYQGFVMSDWGAVHSTVKAAKAGLDQESGAELDKAIYFGEPLQKAVASGEVSMGEVDTKLRNILTGVIASGLYDHPTPAHEQTIDYTAHAQVAQRAAEEGMVLLRNAGNMLPLTASAKRIVVIGGHADIGVLSGGGSSQVRSVGGVALEIPLKSGPAASFSRTTWHSSSPLAAIRALMPSAQVTYIDGTDPAAAAAAARGADVAIIFATQWRTEAEDVPDLALPDGQDGLIEAVAAANPHTAVVLETGGAVKMPWLTKVGAVLEAWYPGQRGGPAIANVLFGKVNPSGHLPLTFPASEAQAPRPAPVGLEMLRGNDAAANADGNGVDVPPFPITYQEGANAGYRWYAARGEKPLFPFGYGLSYTHFGYSHLSVTGGTQPVISFDVTNLGKRDGADVPQVYATLPGSPVPRLIAFDRVTLKPGETRRVTLRAEPRILAHWDEATKGWRIAGGRYTVTLAHDAADRGLSAPVTLTPRSF
ncbi:MAG: glycoside hydrolase family 3 protein [Sphingomonadales bacterium]|nr:glycoside hydrolase family 3 protein [Sphingomonadales bacterium]MDE2170433.1 glycoside hydrolase family 3 protein [Sphingomonadales bacterium]